MKTTELALMFDTVGDKSEVHVADCASLGRAGKSPSGVRRYRLIKDDVLADVEDLRERGYKVVFCKCTK